MNKGGLGRIMMELKSDLPRLNQTCQFVNNWINLKETKR